MRPWTPGGGGGAAWESEMIDFTTQNTGSILGGTTAYTTDGGHDLSLTTINDANCSDISVDIGVGLTIQGISGNFDATTPGVTFDPRDVFADYDPATDDIAVTIDASYSPANGNYAGAFLLVHKVSALSTYFASAGIAYIDGIKDVPRRLIGGGATETDAAGANEPYLTVHVSNRDVRVCTDSAAPSTPYAATPIRAAFVLEQTDTYGGTANYTAANTRFAIVGIGAGGKAGLVTVTVRSIRVWRLKRDSAA